jgi:hypothetical protein
MFRTVAIVLAITLVSLSAARAEDPDQQFEARFHASVPPLPDSHHHAASLSDPKKSFWCLGC